MFSISFVSKLFFGAARYGTECIGLFAGGSNSALWVAVIM